MLFKLWVFRGLGGEGRNWISVHSKNLSESLALFSILNKTFGQFILMARLYVIR